MGSSCVRLRRHLAKNHIRRRRNPQEIERDKGERWRMVADEFGLLLLKIL